MSLIRASLVRWFSPSVEVEEDSSSSEEEEEQEIKSSLKENQIGGNVQSSPRQDGAGGNTQENKPSPRQDGAGGNAQNVGAHGVRSRQSISLGELSQQAAEVAKVWSNNRSASGLKIEQQIEQDGQPRTPVPTVHL